VNKAVCVKYSMRDLISWRQLQLATGNAAIWFKVLIGASFSRRFASASYEIHFWIILKI